MEWWVILLIVMGSILILLTFATIFYKPFFKRVIDIVCSLLAIIVFSWLYIVLAILVRVKLGSPIIFTQVRPGKKDKNGEEKLFKLYKFRTMTDKRDEFGNLLPDEKRLTKFGEWLRSTSLDELPEAFNILFGDMSVIGPRPQLVRDLVFMTEEQRKRHNVKPGLSGLAQVRGRNSISWEKKFEADLEYINKITLWKDIKIIFQTVFKAFVKKEGINEEGMATSLDFGDHLLKEGLISEDEYSLKQKKAQEIIKEKANA